MKIPDYGRLRDGRNAIEAILEAAKKHVGLDKQQLCDKLLEEFQMYVNNDIESDTDTSRIILIENGANAKKTHPDQDTCIQGFRES